MSAWPKIIMTANTLTLSFPVLIEKTISKNSFSKRNDRSFGSQRGIGLCGSIS